MTAPCAAPSCEVRRHELVMLATALLNRDPLDYTEELRAHGVDLTNASHMFAFANLQDALRYGVPMENALDVLTQSSEQVRS